MLDPIELIGAMAVPGMLLAYGIALRLGPGFGGEVPAAELALTSTPQAGGAALVAYAVAHFALGLSGHALLAVVVCSSLPTAQNVFVHATRYDRSPTLARDTILVTTVGAVPLITLVVWLLGLSLDPRTAVLRCVRWYLAGPARVAGPE